MRAAAQAGVSVRRISNCLWQFPLTAKSLILRLSCFAEKCPKPGTLIKIYDSAERNHGGIRMKNSSATKITIGLLLVAPAFLLMRHFHDPTLFVVGALAMAAGALFLILGSRQMTPKRPELKDFPDEVVINGVHYPKSAFKRVNVFVQGRETVFAIKELRQITGISLEEAKEVVNNWDQYYNS